MEINGRTEVAGMAVIKSFRELNVYRTAPAGAQRMFLVPQGFPKEESCALTDQVRRASRAVGALMAEARARRRYPAAFINKINEALGEAHETQAWLDHARNCAYIDDANYHDLDQAWQHIGAMLNCMIQRANNFCPPQKK